MTCLRDVSPLVELSASASASDHRVPFKGEPGSTTSVATASGTVPLITSGWPTLAQQAISTRCSSRGIPGDPRRDHLQRNALL